MAYELPSFYDSVLQVVRPMDTGDQIPPAQVPISARAQNLIQILSDGLYYGPPTALPLVVYVNTATGVNAPGNGTLAVPYATLDYALSQLSTESVNSQLSTSVVVALQAGQTFIMNNDLTLYGGTLTFTFYGDANYGSGYNSVPIGTGANPWYMTDLARPVIAPTVSLVNEFWHLAGVNVAAGNVSLAGVQLNLPNAPAETGIALYSNAADFVRTVGLAAITPTITYTTGGFLDLRGAVINMQDITAFWGVLGIGARSTYTLVQYASQFQIGGEIQNAAAAPTNAELIARQYFIKFYPDFVGNNQQQGLLYDTALTATPASGLLNVLWADTESFVVETTKTNLASFPVCYDLTYGLRNYMYGITFDGVNRPWNVNSSREI